MSPPDSLFAQEAPARQRYNVCRAQVPRPLQRLVEYRAMNVRRWDRIVEAWAAGDLQGLDDE